MAVLQKVELTDGLDTFVEKVNALIDDINDNPPVDNKIRRESFTVTASQQSSFTLAETPDESSMIVALDGILLEESDYSVTNDVIDLTEPALQDQVLKVFYQI